ncbi:serine protease [Marinobacter sp. AL4B]|uniref:S1 family peptidase n=1 Tax=Marinobacter sp. AL4B TaxID=2871173 RepID=UPI001CAA753E|nr:serine protease [Marinobacter sp. AL4B]MBZ0335006.1 serine protease [Marinobacter sp. AL4B]
MDLEKFEEQVFFSTVRITIPQASGEGASIGTGFLFKAPLGDDSNRAVMLLISNKHVYGNPNQKITLNFHRRDPEDPSRPLLGEIKTLEADNFSGVYSEHPNPSVDLACLNVSVITQEDQEIFHKNLYPEMLSTFQEPDLLPGKDVWFVGYPENRYDVAHNLPILRKGYIASVPKINFNNHQQMVIDAQVFPGSSGSPVFATLGSHFKLVGVVTETMIKHQQLQTIPVGVSAGVQQVLGLGIVLKTALVQELLETVTSKVREELDQQEPEPLAENSSRQKT